MLATHQDFEELTEIMFNNNIFPIVSQVYKLEDLKVAQEHFVSKNFIGKIILDCEK